MKWLILIAATCLPFSALAAERPAEDDKGIISLVAENDLFAGQDSDYTNGVRAAWLSPEERMPQWLRWTADRLPLLSDNGHKRISVAAGQSMFTPDDVRQRDHVRGARPYAGWLYGSLGIVSDTGETLDNVQLTLGVVGPASFAEQAQKFIHQYTGSPHPLGWHKQLQNEIGAILTYERKWRGLYEFSPFGLGADVTPHLGVNLGNIYTDASAGATLRLGFDLPADYGPPRIRPSLPGSDFFIPTRDLSGYVFLGAEGRGVARNIFLDGNTFRNSYSVDKKPLVGSLQGGVAVTWQQARLSYTHVLMTREYDSQSRPSQFGAVSLSWRF